MFLFAKLVMENLHEQQCLEHVQIELYKELPKDLEEAYVLQQFSNYTQLLSDLTVSSRYKRILKRIERKYRWADNQLSWNLTRKLLGWLICAKRPFRWSEIQSAICLDPHNKSFNRYRALKENITTLCGSLVQILDGDRIELIHTSAKTLGSTAAFFHETA